MPILSDLSDQKLAAAVERNQIEWIRIQGRLPWVQFHDDGDAVRSFAGDTWPRNMVARSRFTPETAHRRVGEILSEHLRKKVSCNWVVGPESQPSNLSQFLRAHGFSCRIHCAGMACDLSSLVDRPTVTEDIVIEQVDAAPIIHPLTTERRRNLHRGLTLAAALKPRHVWHFAAAIDSQRIGTTTLQTGAGVAGIYGVEVLARHRGKGIGTALVYAALEHGKTLGFSVAVLSATGKGEGVYKRLGFREVCKLSFWKYGKMRQLD